jgi:hypothetical protein
VAADGSAVFGLRSSAPGAISLLRWTPSGGVELFEIEDAGELAPPQSDPLLMRPFIQDVSANGMAVVIADFSGDTHRLWRLGHDQNRAMKVNATPTHFSGDGSKLFLHVEEASDKRHIYRASVEGEPFTLEELKQPPGYTDCNPNWRPAPNISRWDSVLIFADGSVVVGTCGWSTGSPSMFRWEAGDETMTLVPEGPAFPMLMSPDGSKILGTSRDDSHSADSKLVWWTPETSLVVPTAGTPIGLRPDDVSAWVVLGEDLNYRGPRLWSRSEGLLPLQIPSAALEVNVNLVALSADGALALGSVGIDVPGESRAGSHSLLWDGPLGMRDIAEELSAAGLDLSKYDTGLQGFALHVDDDAIVIVGGTISDDGSQTWLAKIPAR